MPSLSLRNFTACAEASAGRRKAPPITHRLGRTAGVDCRVTRRKAIALIIRFRWLLLSLAILLGTGWAVVRIVKIWAGPFDVALRDCEYKKLWIHLQFEPELALGWRVLHYPVAKNYKETVKLLLSKGAELDTTTLPTAIAWGDKELVEILLEGLRGGRRERLLIFALSSAVHLNEVEIVRLLIREGAQVNGQGAHGLRPLHFVAAHLPSSRGGKDNLRMYSSRAWYQCDTYLDTRRAGSLLLQHGADVHARDAAGRTALHYVISGREKQAASFLIEHGADVNAQDKDGRTCLHLTAENEWSPTLAEFYIEKGAEVNAADHEGHTPLHVVRTARDATILIEHGGDVNARDEGGGTPLHHAASLYDEEVVEVLFRNSADPRAEDNDGRTPLHFARNEETAKMLIERGADVNETDREGNTPLHAAARHSEWSVMQVLLESLAKVNATNSKGETPLHLAAKYAGASKVGSLLAHGADVNLRDNDGNTALSLAIAREHDPIAARLRRHGAKE